MKKCVNFFRKPPGTGEKCVSTVKPSSALRGCLETTARYEGHVEVINRFQGKAAPRGKRVRGLPTVTYLAKQLLSSQLPGQYVVALVPEELDRHDHHVVQQPVAVPVLEERAPRNHRQT